MLLLIRKPIALSTLVGERTLDLAMPLGSTHFTSHIRGYNEYPDKSPIGPSSRVPWTNFERQEVWTPTTKAICGPGFTEMAPAHADGVRDPLIDSHIAVYRVICSSDGSHNIQRYPEDRCNDSSTSPESGGFRMICYRI